MNSSRASIPEPLQYSGGNAGPGAEDNNEKPEPALPPFDVLLQWLSYYHTRTGVWPSPEENKDKRPPVINYNPRRTEDKPLLKVLTNKPNKPGKAAAIPDFTYFDYKSSIYYQVALEQIEKHVPAPEGKLLDETRVLTLASVLAWCHQPVFLAGYKDKGYGLGMYLPLDRWSKELKMRKATLGACLKDLEAAGMIKICTPDFEKGNSVKRFYRVTASLQNVLPTFEPGQTVNALACAGRTEEYKTGSRESLNKSREPVIESVPASGNDFEQSPMNMDSQFHVNNNKNIKPKTIKHEHVSSLTPGTIDENFEFLSQKATFPGYSSPDGLVALDSREAFKFASNPALDLFTIKRIYHQVLWSWSAGKCTKNPIGFFHHSLTQYLKKGSPNPPELLKRPVYSIPADPSPIGTTGKTGSRFRPSNSTSNKNRVGDPPVDRAASFDCEELPAAGENLNLVKHFDQEEQSAPLNIIKIQQTLKERVIEALQDRFRQPELASKMACLTWVVCQDNQNVQLRLESQERDFPGASTFSQSDFSLVKIASSQILKSLDNKAKNFELWFENILR